MYTYNETYSNDNNNTNKTNKQKSNNYYLIHASKYDMLHDRYRCSCETDVVGRNYFPA